MRFLARHGAEVLVAALVVAALAGAHANSDAGSTAAVYLLPLGWTLPLLARNRYPAAACLTVLGCLALESQLAEAITESLPALPPVIWAFWIAGSIQDRSRALAVGAAGAVLTTVVVAANPDQFDAGDVTFLAILVAAPFAAGMIASTREQRATDLLRTAELEAREREQRVHATVAAERAQIARELHDVIGHAISVMTVQAGAARMQLATRPLQAEEPLLAVEKAGRQALAEMRRMLEILRADDRSPDPGPQPGLSALDGLLQQVRDSGLPVELDVDGDPVELTPGVDLAAYRIIQEALTNVLKHAHNARAWVQIRYTSGALDLTVENDGTQVAGEAADGRGLTGMRERVALYRGDLEAGPRPTGGFVVHAHLPVGGEGQ